MNSPISTIIVECSPTLGSALSALPKSPCPNSPKRPAVSTDGRPAVRHVMPHGRQRTRRSADFPQERSSGVYGNAEATPSGAASAKKSKTAHSSANHMRVRTVPCSEATARLASRPALRSGIGITAIEPSSTVADGASRRNTGSPKASTTACSQPRTACAPSAAKTSLSRTGAREPSSDCPSTTTTRLARCAACFAKGATEQSACSGMTSTFCGRRLNTFCAIRINRKSKGGGLHCPPFERGGQSFGD